MKEDIELQKIQTLDSHFQTWFNFIGSIVTGVVIGLSIAFITLFYEGVVGLALYFLAFAVVYAALGYCLWFMRKRNDEYLEFIDSLYARIEKGETLPSLMELQRQFSKKK
jgi:hypothetical protein